MAEVDAIHSTRMWLKHAPTYKIRGANLSRLMKRPKNNQKDIDAANAVVAQMEDAPADACSAKFVNETGKMLVCVFSHRGPAGSAD